jgi:4-hydroxybutyryl-CoA dehydratase/vinylacetyl-CoA-Delta-isomerase
MHGGGSPDGAKLVIRFTTSWEEYVEYARNIMGIEEDVPEP